MKVYSINSRSFFEIILISAIKSYSLRLDCFGLKPSQRRLIRLCERSEAIQCIINFEKTN